MSRLVPREEPRSGFTMFPNDWLDSRTTRRMTFAEEGLYARLFVASWRYMGLPVELEEVEELIEKRIPDELLWVLEEVFPVCTKAPHAILQEDLDSFGGLRRYCVKGGLETQRAKSRGGKKGYARSPMRDTRSGIPVGSPGRVTPEKEIEEEKEIEKEKKRETERSWVDLPESLDTPEVHEALAEWVKVRARKKASNEPAAKTRARNKLVRLSGGDPDLAVRVLNYSSDGGYPGLYDPDSRKPVQDKAARNRAMLADTARRLSDAG